MRETKLKVFVVVNVKVINFHLSSERMSLDNNFSQSELLKFSIKSKGLEKSLIEDEGPDIFSKFVGDFAYIFVRRCSKKQQ